MNPTNNDANSIDQLALPPRLRESAFRNYEDSIALIVKSYPVAGKVSYTGSAVTFCARLRDAMLSLHRFQWKTDKIDVAKFNFNYHDIVISHRDNGVFAGSREYLKQLDHEIKAVGFEQLSPESQNYLPSPEVSTATPVIITLSDDNVIRDIQLQLLCLLSSKRIVSPVIIVNLNENQRNWCEANFDVRLDLNPDNTYTLL